MHHPHYSRLWCCLINRGAQRDLSRSSLRKHPQFTKAILFFFPHLSLTLPPADLSVVPTTSGSVHPQTVRSSSASSSYHASTSELNDVPGPSTSCAGSAPESLHSQRPGASARTATEGTASPRWWRIHFNGVAPTAHTPEWRHLPSCLCNPNNLFSQSE